MNITFIKYPIVASTEFSNSATWHQPFGIKLNNSCILKFNGLDTGCGLMSVSGVSKINDDITDNEVNEILTLIRTATDCTSFIATLGQNYFSSESVLKKLGFNNIAEYSNGRHRGAPQRIYLLDLH